MASQPARKAERIDAYVRALGLEGAGYDPCYVAYFGCFNAQEYYEAHDVLEHLWLKGTAGNHAFYKGLIQFAGAFVHLQKQHARPTHPKDGRRTRPAVRLFALAAKNLAPYAPAHEGLDVAAVLAMGEDFRRRIEEGNFTRNPWSPAAAPKLALALPPAG